MKEFLTYEKPQWCPGCGDYAIHMALKQALHELSLQPENVVIVSGIGCGSKIPHYIRSYGYEGIHGRLIPLASGIKLANPSLTVVAIGGDGDGFAEGGNHFIHGARFNWDITYLVQDNAVYGLTTGQASPTTPKGMKTKTTPDGNSIEQYRPLPLALAAGASFVAAAFAGDVKHTKEVIKRAIQHKGFSFVDIYQPCVTWNYINTYDWFRQRVYKLEETNHDPKNWRQAWEKVWEPYLTDWQRIPVGVIYEIEKETMNDIVGRGINFFEEYKDLESIDVSSLLAEMR